MDNCKNILPLMTGILLALLIYLIFLRPSPEPVIETVEIIKRDTITVQAEPIIIKKAVPTIRYLRDTIIVTKPFIAELDTIIKFDTIYVAYRYPDNLMNLLIRKRPDTLYKDTIIITNTVTEERSVWTDILTHTAVGVISFILGGAK